MRVLRSNGGTGVEIETVKLTLDATLEPLRTITSVRRARAVAVSSIRPVR
jgi:hypothetical protein